MTACVHILLGLIVAGFLAPKVSKAEEAKNELEGTWVMVSVERDGRAIRPQTNLKMIYTADKFVLKSGDDVVVAGTIKLDPTKKPKTIDTTYTEGPNKGQTLKGIYEVDGDTAKFCRAGEPDQDRPTEFKTKAGSGGLFSVYKRAKP
jgi:uncharacterized protein (TIGR03067 family)